MPRASACCHWDRLDVRRSPSAAAVATAAANLAFAERAVGATEEPEVDAGPVEVVPALDQLSGAVPGLERAEADGALLLELADDRPGGAGAGERRDLGGRES